MADSKSLEETLQLYKALQKNEGSAPAMRQPLVQPRQEVISGSPEALNEAVYGKYVDNNPNKWSADKEMEEIKNGRAPRDLSHSKLPKAILDSMLSTPLNEVPIDPRMDELMARLQNVTGIDKISQINERVEDLDKQKQIEKITESGITPINTSASNVDYSLIKTIVEDAVDKKIESLLRVVLEEGKTHGNGLSPKMKVMQLCEDKFMFLDTDNNVYECKMVYKGKNKSKK
jgi:hypothetical protein